MPMGKNLLPVGIVGVGSYVPEKILTNKDLEKMVETSDEWIVSRTGIRERHIADTGQGPTDLALVASRRALEDAGVMAEEVDLIIVSTNFPEMFTPHISAVLQYRLGVSNKAGTFDLHAGCSGFVYALTTAYWYLASGAYKTALVIGTEVLSRYTNWEDRTTCVLFGDGAGAVVLRQVPPGYGVLASRLGSNGAMGGAITSSATVMLTPSSGGDGNPKSHLIQMKGRDVFRFAVKIIEDESEDILAEAGLKLEDLNFFIPHQANIRIIEAGAKRLGLKDEQVMVSIGKYGNTSTASIPLALDDAIKENMLEDGHNIFIMAFGAGLAWAGIVMRWYDYR